jgi:hypothetical protein
VTPGKKKKKRIQRKPTRIEGEKERERRVVERTWSTKKREKNNLS